MGCTPRDAQMSINVRVRRTATRWQKRFYDTEMSHIQHTSSTVHHQMARHANTQSHGYSGIARSKRDGTRTETRFGLSAKRTSPFKSARVSVQSTTGSRGVRISG